MVDLAIVGAGILGLAHAYHAARRGLRVAVFERSQQAQGASIRNFGMLWPIGQPAGERYALALRSRELWLELLAEAGLWHDRCGSLHLAYADDETAVIQELLESGNLPVRWFGPSAVGALAPLVRRDGLQGALWSEHEVCVDPRDVIAKLPAFLAQRYGVRFHFGTAVLGFMRPHLGTSQGPVEAQRLLICSGDELALLYPEALADPELVRCKLQMMRTTPLPGGQRIGPMLAAGLTLTHYTAFASCPTLPRLRQRFAEQLPDYGKYGIHVLVSQNGHGELTLGDSHEYGAEISPFDNPEIDRLVLDYLATFLAAPTMEIGSRWQGHYLKHRSQPWWITHPDEGVTIVTGVGGAGMTLSFGLAERVLEEL